MHVFIGIMYFKSKYCPRLLLGEGENYEKETCFAFQDSVMQVGACWMCSLCTHSFCYKAFNMHTWLYLAAVFLDLQLHYCKIFTKPKMT
jgi:hypothetical protein